MESPRETRRSDPAAAVPFLERKLDELYRVLRGARCANALIDAKSPLEERNYREAFRLIRGARDAYVQSPSQDWRKRAAEVFGPGDPAKEMLSRFSMVLNLLEKMADAQSQAPQPAPAARPKPPSRRVGDAAADEPSQPDAPAPRLPAVTALDTGAFTQLHTAAQQSGLVPNADAILSVRDRDYPKGQYQRALEVIEGLYSQLNAHATRRQQDLRQEEMQFRAGTLKMSPKAWFIRQRQARDQTQKIDRARRYFARVLDGLRVLRAANPE